MSGEGGQEVVGSTRADVSALITAHVIAAPDEQLERILPRPKRGER